MNAFGAFPRLCSTRCANADLDAGRLPLLHSNPKVWDKTVLPSQPGKHTFAGGAQRRILLLTTAPKREQTWLAFLFLLLQKTLTAQTSSFFFNRLQMQVKHFASKAYARKSSNQCVTFLDRCLFGAANVR
ncbi:unnamed protein product [Effrenium voratum]|uniref:Uncharacterized protein n=1 Tax=Effrenium voratum TaxID=2562239 RepID=A0AA36ILW5_9DINO|nr:unnamed protein product [Effrenium voratum]CAJ1425687.1 unnamed protein product [Effrenium voratum]